MANLKPINLYRNLICASIALLLLFSTAIFVLTSLYQKQIDQLIDDATLLKEYLFYHSAISTRPGGPSCPDRTPATSKP